jgi:uncharacterized protein involved in exopolysaccharide biosynthesis
MSTTSEHLAVDDGWTRTVEPFEAPLREKRPRADHPLGPLRPVAARWWIVAIVTLLFAGGAVPAASRRAPTYTASTTINVGRVDVRVQALPGYVAGATSLAASYSRIATSDRIVVPLAQRLKLTPAAVRSRLSATQIPGAPMFTIYGSGADGRQAVAFTDAASRELRTYVRDSGDGTASVRQLLSDWREQARTAASLKRRIAALPEGSPSADSLQVDLDTAQLKEQTLRGQYEQRSAEVASTAGIEVISEPVQASSDAHRTLQRFLVVGLLAGLLVGSALAVLFDRVRRSGRRA